VPVWAGVGTLPRAQSVARVPVPETRYALSGDIHVAFQVMGNCPTNLVYIPGWVSHLELELENGLSRLFYEALASFTTLVRFDKRGTGMSDRAVPHRHDAPR
jgi:pimeloyl-ACP methyl ester carboxylesterase